MTTLGLAPGVHHVTHDGVEQRGSHTRLARDEHYQNPHFWFTVSRQHQHTAHASLFSLALQSLQAKSTGKATAKLQLDMQDGVRATANSRPSSSLCCMHEHHLGSSPLCNYFCKYLTSQHLFLSLLLTRHSYAGLLLIPGAHLTTQQVCMSTPFKYHNSPGFLTAKHNLQSSSHVLPPAIEAPRRIIGLSAGLHVA